MSIVKWIALVVAIVTSAGAGINTLPFGWAHDTATAIAAMMAAFNGTATVYYFRHGKGNS